MQTVWMGLGIPTLSRGVGTAEGLEGLAPQSCPVVLSDTPSVVLQVTLPVGTRQIWLWTPVERVWYALDALPGPIPVPVPGTVLPSSIFVPGALLVPAQWQALAMDAAGSHVLGLVSEAMSPTVYLTLWVETF